MMDAPLRGGYCAICAGFDEARYQQDWHPIYFLVFGFIHRFMRRNLAKSGTDYVTNKIASEIWLYNIGQTLLNRDYPEIADSLEDEVLREGLLKKCNAYSLSQYLDIPHETVRRKVQLLIDNGWVSRDEDGALSITAACEAEFKPDFNLETMRDFVSTARAVMAMLNPRK